MEIYTDISYGFKMIQKNVREMVIAQPPLVPTGLWITQRLYIDNQGPLDSVFGLYQNGATNSVDFVFVPDQSDETVREVLLSIPNSATAPALIIALNGNAYTVQITGVKNTVPFDMSTVILKR